MIMLKILLKLLFHYDYYWNVFHYNVHYILKSKKLSGKKILFPLITPAYYATIYLMIPFSKILKF